MQSKTIPVFIILVFLCTSVIGEGGFFHELGVIIQKIFKAAMQPVSWECIENSECPGMEKSFECISQDPYEITIYHTCTKHKCRVNTREILMEICGGNEICVPGEMWCVNNKSYNPNPPQITTTTSSPARSTTSLRPTTSTSITYSSTTTSNPTPTSVVTTIITTSSISTTTLMTSTSTTTTLASSSTITSTTSTTSTQPTTTTSRPTTTTFSSNPCVQKGCPINTKYVSAEDLDHFHKCDCQYTETIKLEDIICYGSVKEAADDGKIDDPTCVNI